MVYLSTEPRAHISGRRNSELLRVKPFLLYSKCGGWNPGWLGVSASWDVGPDRRTNFQPKPGPEPGPWPTPGLQQTIGVREPTTRTTCDSVNPYFGVWLRVQGLTRSFRRPAIWALAVWTHARQSADLDIVIVMVNSGKEIYIALEIYRLSIEFQTYWI
jgi:hypothetical protein